MNEEKPIQQFPDWKDILLSMDSSQINHLGTILGVHNSLDNTQIETLEKILHWLKVINEAGTMTDIRLSHMRYGKKGDDSYSIKLLISEISEILEKGEYKDNQKDYLNGLYKWYSDNHKNLIKSYN